MHRTIGVIKAQEQAEAVSVTVGADAEKKAAEDRAEAIQAEGEVEAASIRAKNEANAMIPQAFVAFELMQARIRILPEALKALMEPTSRIESIRVVDTSGFSAGRGASEGASGPGNLADQLLSFSGNKPLIDAILAEAGLPGAGGTLKDLVGVSSPSTATPSKGSN